MPMKLNSVLPRNWKRPTWLARRVWEPGDRTRDRPLLSLHFSTLATTRTRSSITRALVPGYAARRANSRHNQWQLADRSSTPSNPTRSKSRGRRDRRAHVAGHRGGNLHSLAITNHLPNLPVSRDVPSLDRLTAQKRR